MGIINDPNVDMDYILAGILEVDSDSPRNGNVTQLTEEERAQIESVEDVEDEEEDEEEEEEKEELGWECKL